MAQHAQLRTDTDLDIYFCDPQSPWQRGTNENTNGLLRQYFPKGTDLTRHSPTDLDAVAAALNSRPRKTLGWKTPAETLTEHLHSLKQSSVATTPLNLSSIGRYWRGLRVVPHDHSPHRVLVEAIRAEDVAGAERWISEHLTKVAGGLQDRIADLRSSH